MKPGQQLKTSFSTKLQSCCSSHGQIGSEPHGGKALMWWACVKYNQGGRGRGEGGGEREREREGPYGTNCRTSVSLKLSGIIHRECRSLEANRQWATMWEHAVTLSYNSTAPWRRDTAGTALKKTGPQNMAQTSWIMLQCVCKCVWLQAGADRASSLVVHKSHHWIMCRVWWHVCVCVLAC